MLKVFIGFLFIFNLISIKDAKAQTKLETLFQISTIDALLNGLYEGDLMMLRLKGNGDFGIGTFNQLDGEMILLNNIVYKIKSDGTAVQVQNSEKTPFATVTFFDADTILEVKEEMGLEKLQHLINSFIPSPNIFYAIKIEADFKYVKTRSVPPQQKPYVPLVQVVANQPVFEFKDTKGTLAGFRTPDYFSGINVPGFHFHFLNSQRTAGGHLLDCKISNAKISIDFTHNFTLRLPEDKSFYETDLSKNKKEELEKVEK